MRSGPWDPHPVPELASGIPSRDAYRKLLSTRFFLDIEKFSDTFIHANRPLLKAYARRWVLDPLHHWSRQWEYPYVIAKLNKISSQRQDSMRILDAGSGVSFLPYLLADYTPAEVMCCDVDPKLTKIFAALDQSEKTSGKVQFQLSDLRALRFDAASFDVVYSVSVLEHTTDYHQIVDEIHRVLNEKGRLVLTIDISLDGSRDISAERANELLSSIDQRFYFESDTKGDGMDRSTAKLAAGLARADVFTTLDARDLDPGLLPWIYPAFVYQVQTFLRRRTWVAWPPQLTVFCGSFLKR